MRWYILAGEASGDLHASKIVRRLLERNPATEIRAWGGDLMEQAGAKVVKHYRDLAFMGFLEVIRHLPEIMRNFDFCKEDILSFKPDVILMVDYPGFNLRMADWAHKQGIPVHYYISPQVWAWKKGRVKKIRAFVDKMYVILPFEKEFYSRYGMEVEYVGHPLLDEVAERTYSQDFRERYRLTQAPILALLPGSRKQEITNMLPIMLQAASKFPDFQICVAAAPAQEESFYQQFVAGFDVRLIKNETYELLHQASLAAVTSGTATLETALHAVPQVVCYKGSWLSYEIGKRLVDIKYISLVNLILDKPAVKELIQNDLNAITLFEELKKISQKDTETYQRMMADYKELHSILGNAGASDRLISLLPE